MLWLSQGDLVARLNSRGSASRNLKHTRSVVLNVTGDSDGESHLPAVGDGNDIDIGELGTGEGNRDRSADRDSTDVLSRGDRDDRNLGVISRSNSGHVNGSTTHDSGDGGFRSRNVYKVGVYAGVLDRAETPNGSSATAVQERGRVDHRRLRALEDLEHAIEVTVLTERVRGSVKDINPLPVAVKTGGSAKRGARPKALKARDKQVSDDVVHEDNTDGELSLEVLGVNLGNARPVEAKAALDLGRNELCDENALVLELLKADVTVVGGLGRGVGRDMALDLKPKLVLVRLDGPVAVTAKSEAVPVDEGLGLRLDPITTLLFVATEVVLEVVSRREEREHRAVRALTDSALRDRAAKLKLSHGKRVKVDRLDIDLIRKHDERLINERSVSDSVGSGSPELDKRVVDIPGRRRTIVLL